MIYYLAAVDISVTDIAKWLKWIRTMTDLTSLTRSLVITEIYLIISLVWWVVQSLAYRVVYRKMAYGKSWCAWLPIIRDIGIVDCLSKTQTHNTITMAGFNISLNKIRVGLIVYLVINEFTDLFGTKRIIAVIISILGILLTAVEYTTVFSYVEGKTVEEEQMVGTVASIFPVVAIVKFFRYSR